MALCKCIIVCPIHVHGFGQTKFSLMSVRTYVRVYTFVRARALIAWKSAASTRRRAIHNRQLALGCCLWHIAVAGAVECEQYMYTCTVWKGLGTHCVLQNIADPVKNLSFDTQTEFACAFNFVISSYSRNLLQFNACKIWPVFKCWRKCTATASVWQQLLRCTNDRNCYTNTTTNETRTLMNNLPDADEQSWCSTLDDLTTARNNVSALHTRLRCDAMSLSSGDSSAKQPINQLLFTTGRNLRRQYHKYVQLCTTEKEQSPLNIIYLR